MKSTILPREKIVQIVKGADGVRHLVERPSMTHREKLAFIIQKCIDANPSVVSGSVGVCRDGKYIKHRETTRPITLADVLLAAEKASSDRASEGMTPESFAECSHLAEMLRESWWATILDTWNLRNPFEDQDEPTISFLYDILN